MASRATLERRVDSLEAEVERVNIAAIVAEVDEILDRLEALPWTPELQAQIRELIEDVERDLEARARR